MNTVKAHLREDHRGEGLLRGGTEDRGCSSLNGHWARQTWQPSQWIHTVYELSVNLLLFAQT